MARIAAGDADAFRQLVDRHADRVLALARRVLLHRPDAEDVAQEVFTRLWTRPDGYRQGRGRFTTWLYRVVVNASLNARRKHGEDPLPATEEPADTTDPGPEALARGRESRARIDAALADLPVNQRTAMALILDRELNNREAAAAMGLSVKALEALLVRARRTLRNRLTDLK